jgi:hypothetical protein
LSEQFDCRYFVLHDEASAEWAVQPFFFVTQDALGGCPRRAARFLHRSGGSGQAFLNLRMMMVGCAAGEGELDHASPWLATALREAIEAYRRKARLSIILLQGLSIKLSRSALAVFQ